MRSRPLVFSVLGVGFAVAFVVGIAVGSVTIPVADTVRVLFGRAASDPTYDVIIHTVRIPRSITASLAGASLAAAGLQMQTLFRNPLADPFVLGITAGASLGVALVVLVAGGTGGAVAGAGLLASFGAFANVSVVLAASLGAGAALTLVLILSRRVRSAITVLVLGLMVSYLASAVVSVLMAGASGDRLRQFTAWGLGSFRSTTWSDLRVFVPALAAGLVLSLVGVKQLNALLLGETYAASLGVPVRRARLQVLIGASVLAGVVTAFCGPIAFIGVAVPHLARGLVRTSDHRVLMPAAMLLGATIALLCDVAAQLPGQDAVLPLNAVTSLVGAPVVVFVLLRRRGMAEAMAR